MNYVLTNSKGEIRPPMRTTENTEWTEHTERTERTKNTDETEPTRTRSGRNEEDRANKNTARMEEQSVRTSFPCRKLG